MYREWQRPNTVSGIPLFHLLYSTSSMYGLGSVREPFAISRGSFGGQRTGLAIMQNASVWGDAISINKRSSPFSPPQKKRLRFHTWWAAGHGQGSKGNQRLRYGRFLFVASNYCLCTGERCYVHSGRGKEQKCRRWHRLARPPLLPKNPRPMLQHQAEENFAPLKSCLLMDA